MLGSVVVSEVGSGGRFHLLNEALLMQKPILYLKFEEVFDGFSEFVEKGNINTDHERKIVCVSAVTDISEEISSFALANGGPIVVIDGYSLNKELGHTVVTKCKDLDVDFIVGLPAEVPDKSSIEKQGLSFLLDMGLSTPMISKEKAEGSVYLFQSGF